MILSIQGAKSIIKEKALLLLAKQESEKNGMR
jgi:hypothetical protein